MSTYAQARIVGLLRNEGATEDEIFAYLTDKRSGAGMSKQEAAMYLVWEEQPTVEVFGAVQGGVGDQVAISAVFPADLVRDNQQPRPFLSLGCLGWVMVAIVLLVALLLFADPLFAAICANGWDSSNHVACRHVDPYMSR